MSERVQVLFCTDGIYPYSVGGMQRHSRLLIEALAEFEDLELHVVHNHEGESVFNDPRVHEIVLPGHHFDGTYLKDCRNYSKAMIEVTRQYPDAVIYSQGISIWKGMKEVGYRMINNPHGLESFQSQRLRDRMAGLPFNLIFRRLFKRSAYVVSLGGKLTRILKKVMDPKKVVVLPNATELKDEVKPREMSLPLRLMFVGRYEPNKGIEFLMEAVKLLNEAGYKEKFTLDMVGKGRMFEQITGRYSFDNVHFHGFVEDDQLEALYRGSHVFVLPTLFEGMPTVVLEAMAYGMPIIVTDVGATLELVGKENGWIIEKKSPQDIFKVVKSIIDSDDPKHLHDLSLKSIEKVAARFTWDKVAEGHMRLFRKLKKELDAKAGRKG